MLVATLLWQGVRTEVEAWRVVASAVAAGKVPSTVRDAYRDYVDALDRGTSGDDAIADALRLQIREFEHGIAQPDQARASA